MAIAFKACTDGTKASSSTPFASKPAGTAVGDLIIWRIGIFDKTLVAAVADLTPPSGFTFLDSYHTEDGGAAEKSNLLLYYKFADGGEGSTFTATQASPQYCDVMCYTFSGVSTTIAPSAVSHGGGNPLNTASVATVVANYSGALLFLAGMAYSFPLDVTTGNQPAGMTFMQTPNPDGNLTFDGQASWYQILSSAGSTGTRSIWLTGANSETLMGSMFAFYPLEADSVVAPTYQTSTTALDTLTISKPSGTVSGDLLIAAIANQDTLTPATPPAGWTTISTQAINVNAGGTGDPFASTLCYKIAGGSEPSTYTFVNATSAFGQILMVRYSGFHAADPINTFGATINKYVGAPYNVDSITPTYAECALLLFSMGWSQAVSSVASMTIRATNDTFAFAEQSLTASGATGTRAVTRTTTDGSINWLVAVAPLQGSPPRRRFIVCS
jgi:hypothetical protein